MKELVSQATSFSTRKNYFLVMKLKSALMFSTKATMREK